MESELDFDSKYDEATSFTVEDVEEDDNPKVATTKPLSENLDWSFFSKAPQQQQNKQQQKTHPIPVPSVPQSPSSPSRSPSRSPTRSPTRKEFDPDEDSVFKKPNLVPVHVNKKHKSEQSPVKNHTTAKQTPPSSSSASNNESEQGELETSKLISFFMNSSSSEQQKEEEDRLKSMKYFAFKTPGEPNSSLEKPKKLQEEDDEFDDLFKQKQREKLKPQVEATPPKGIPENNNNGQSQPSPGAQPKPKPKQQFKF